MESPEKLMMLKNLVCDRGIPEKHWLKFWYRWMECAKIRSKLKEKNVDFYNLLKKCHKDNLN